MNIIPVSRLLVLAGLGSLVAAPALAQDAGYWYGGLSAGLTRAHVDEPRITAGLLAAGLATTAISSDNRGGGFKLFAGYQFTPNVALEGGYVNLGQFGFRSSTAPAGTLDGSLRVQGLNLDLVGTLPLNDRWSATARVGAIRSFTRDSFSGAGAVNVVNPSPRANGTHLKLGVGLQYAISRTMLVRADAERYRINDAVGNRGDVNMLSVGLVFPFGGSGLAP